jgi:hypothetical protein
VYSGPFRKQLKRISKPSIGLLERISKPLVTRRVSEGCLWNCFVCSPSLTLRVSNAPLFCPSLTLRVSIPLGVSGVLRSRSFYMTILVKCSGSGDADGRRGIRLPQAQHSRLLASIRGSSIDTYRSPLTTFPFVIRNLLFDIRHSSPSSHPPCPSNLRAAVRKGTASAVLTRCHPSPKARSSPSTLPRERRERIEVFSYTSQINCHSTDSH